MNLQNPLTDFHETWNLELSLKITDYPNAKLNFWNTTKLAVDRFKCAAVAYIFSHIIYKHFNICCFIVVAYITLDRLRAVFLIFNEVIGLFVTQQPPSPPRIAISLLIWKVCSRNPLFVGFIWVGLMALVKGALVLFHNLLSWYETWLAPETRGLRVHLRQQIRKHFGSAAWQAMDLHQNNLHQNVADAEHRRLTDLLHSDCFLFLVFFLLKCRYMTMLVLTEE